MYQVAGYDVGWILIAILVSVRVTVAMLVVPLFGPIRIPAPVKVWLALGLGVVLMPAISPAVPALESVVLFESVLTEIIVGACFGFGFLAAFAATQIAGRALDLQIGYGAASILNPATMAPAPLLGTMFGLLLTAIFLSMDGHHVLVHALAMSVLLVPPGSPIPTADWGMLMSHSSIMFVYAVALAAPVMLMLSLIDLAMAVISRSMPQLNVFILSFTVKILVGLLVMAGSIQFAGGVYHTLSERVFRFWGAGAGL